MLALLSAGFLRGGFGFLKSSSAGEMIKGGGGTLNREIRVGVTHVSYFGQDGVRWLTVRVLNWRLRGCGFEPNQRHCIVSLSKTLYPLLSTGSTQEDPSQHN